MSDDKPTVPTTACVPTIPGRTTPNGPVPGTLLWDALESVRNQTMTPAGGVAVAIDLERRGAAATRQAALDRVETEFVSFLDDDDTWYPHHLATHFRLLREHGADVAYSWFDGNDPFPTHRGKAFDPANPHHLTMTLTVRTAMAQAVGFIQPGGPMHQDWSGEDWQMILGLRDLGAKFIGTGEVTWRYRVHHGNTSGLPTKGDALR